MRANLPTLVSTPSAPSVRPRSARMTGNRLLIRPPFEFSMACRVDSTPTMAQRLPPVVVVGRMGLAAAGVPTA
jgi:hypothetical protein